MNTRKFPVYLINIFILVFIYLFYNKGNLFTDLPLGPVSLNAKLDLKNLREEKKEAMETKVSIQSQP
jgi:hypothetical protein